MSKKIERAVRAAKAAKNVAAVGVEFLENTEEFNGVTFYYCAVIHKWILMKLADPRYKELDNLDKLMITGFVLSHNPDSVTGLIKLFREGTVFEKAFAFAAQFKNPAEFINLVNKLMTHPYDRKSDEAGDDKKKSAKPPLNTTGGAG